ncbi:MAG: hypothetical protein ACM3SY_21790 [Candidatus Omnitrophota bacterium]
MRRIVPIIFIILFSNLIFAVTFDFKCIDQWKHEEIFGNHFFSIIDKDNEVVGSFYKSPIRIISRNKIIQFAPRGEGPSELLGLEALFEYKGDLAAVERPEKMKIFTKKQGTYVWKETKWIKRGRFAHVVKNGIFFDNKFFLAGVEFLTLKNDREVYFLRVLDGNGNLLKQLIKNNSANPRFVLKNYYIKGYKKDRVFFLIENELKVTLISSKTLEIVKEVPLEIPAFYKKMPEDFYTFKKYAQSGNEFHLDLETWSMGYSKITNCCTTDKHLVLQIRTCNDKLKKFALLFYNAETFKLENTVFIDDFFLGYKDGKYYFFANGDPGRDDNTDDCIINIYAFTPSKGKGK